MSTEDLNWVKNTQSKFFLRLPLSFAVDLSALAAATNTLQDSPSVSPHFAGPQQEHESPPLTAPHSASSQRNPAIFLHAYTCLPISFATRQAAGAILQDVADSGVLFALLMCKHKVVIMCIYRSKHKSA
ncbi:uncharacterized protein LOC121994957 [Zingiber officinale]|uniref:uncharacterized protein LOC121994957 n=1 Tax=Zingiber officinale TaxID=94328 RepID=UPI001C4A7E6D|nr:uncharacterized protein LOC121994957 [Zingiber officinale]